MGLQNFVNGFFFVYFLFIAIIIPLFDGQIVLPSWFFPKILVEQFYQHALENRDFLVLEKPDFLIRLTWVELLVQWPLSIANLYAILTNKSWFRKTCLIYGVSTATSLVAILSEMIRSPKSNSKLVIIHAPLLVLALISILNGLLAPPQSVSDSVDIVTSRPTIARKKKA
ncbi:Transmembrane protein 6/97 [Macleaya cordata]|uniref:Transmembrane protein 6/97 n=1 Tax=Macleaya cordata TaxID=56857 RepID=A0A200QL10_MACCD|nr:Transmembrane protein 6/97 [Macleaya cordata]